MPPRRSDTAACTFCEIVSGRLAAEVVYSDDACVAFLDHRPLFHGHVLLAPRDHVVTFAELEPSLASHLSTVWQLLERAVEQAMASDGSLLLVNNVVSQSVPHVHLHVIPRSFKDGLRFWLGPRKKYGEPGGPTIEEIGERIRVEIAGDTQQETQRPTA